MLILVPEQADKIIVFGFQLLLVFKGFSHTRLRGVDFSTYLIELIVVHLSVKSFRLVAVRKTTRISHSCSCAGPRAYRGQDSLQKPHHIVKIGLRAIAYGHVAHGSALGATLSPVPSLLFSHAAQCLMGVTNQTVALPDLLDPEIGARKKNLVSVGSASLSIQINHFLERQGVTRQDPPAGKPAPDFFLSCAAAHLRNTGRPAGTMHHALFN